MDSWQALTLGMIQGITEFLPISSSAHLILVSHWAGWPDQGLFFDVWLHLATLIAVLLFFMKPLWQHCIQRMPAVSHANASPQVHLPKWFLIKLVVACLPIAAFGACAHHWVQTLRTPSAIAFNTLLFAGGLLGALFASQREKTLSTWSFWDAWWLGCFQALAILPGASRAGVTLMGAFWLGYRCESAILLTLWLGIPTIAMAESFELLQLLLDRQTLAITLPHWIGFISSFSVAWLCLKSLSHLKSRWQLLPFIIYRVVLGISLYLTAS